MVNVPWLYPLRKSGIFFSAKLPAWLMLTLSVTQYTEEMLKKINKKKAEQNKPLQPILCSKFWLAWAWVHCAM